MPTGFRAFSTLVLTLVFAASQVSAATHYRGDLDGAQEVPPNASPATGVGQCLIDTGTNTLFFHVSYSGLSGPETAAHIHGFAPSGMNAGVLFGLPGGNPKVGAWSYAAGQEAGILAGQTYFNIHSTVHPGGEIRGQIVPKPMTDLVALIDAGQEVPPNPPSGLGIGVFDIDTAANTLAFDIRFGGLAGTETAAHIHGPAPVGMNAGVLFGLPSGSPKIGSWTYPEPNEAHLLGGLTYVNIHSTLDGAGEIRGQIETAMPVSTDAAELIGAPNGLSLLAAPNPVRQDNVALFFAMPSAGHASVTIHDVQGRVVRTLWDREANERGILAWDTRDAAGQPVSAGVYFAKLTTGIGTESHRLVVIR